MCGIIGMIGREKFSVKDNLIRSVPIPLILATHSEGIWPVVLIEGGHLFRSILVTLSERSDAGVFLFYGCLRFRQVFVSFSWNLLSVEFGERYESIGPGWHRRSSDHRYDRASSR